MKIKKSLFYSCLSLIFINSVNAQMIDLMGSMAVGGSQNRGAIQSVGIANKKLNTTQFIQQLQLKIADITMTYFENYQNMPLQNLNYKNIKVIFRKAEEGRAFEALIDFVNNRSLCEALLTANWDNLKGIRSSDRFYTHSEAIQQKDAICTASEKISLIFK